jgi:ABC-type transport system involved in multi-copper enzyme maturation permease subunit
MSPRITGLVPAERAEGSFESLLAMPIAPWRILLAKTAMGILLCAGPLVAAAIVSAVISGQRKIPTIDILALYFRTILIAVALFTWMLAATSRLPSESRAAMLSVGVLILWWMITVALFSSHWLPPVILAISPLVMIGENPGFFNQQMPLHAIALEQLTILVFVWFFALKPFARPVEAV